MLCKRASDVNRAGNIKTVNENVALALLEQFKFSAEPQLLTRWGFNTLKEDALSLLIEHETVKRTQVLDFFFLSFE